MAWTYHQATGELFRNGKLIAKGYSGAGAGLNNPALETVPKVGPIPKGRWLLDGLYNSKQVGPYAIILDPAPGTVTYGRSGFRCHGDNSKGNRSASHGCIIFPRKVREDMWQLKDHTLLVV